MSLPVRHLLLVPVCLAALSGVSAQAEENTALDQVGVLTLWPESEEPPPGINERILELLRAQSPRVFQVHPVDAAPLRPWPAYADLEDLPRGTLLLLGEGRNRLIVVGILRRGGGYEVSARQYDCRLAVMDPPLSRKTILPSMLPIVAAELVRSCYVPSIQVTEWSADEARLRVSGGGVLPQALSAMLRGPRVTFRLWSTAPVPRPVEEIYFDLSGSTALDRARLCASPHRLAVLAKLAESPAQRFFLQPVPLRAASFVARVLDAASGQPLDGVPLYRNGGGKQFGDRDYIAEVSRRGLRLEDPGLGIQFIAARYNGVWYATPVVGCLSSGAVELRVDVNRDDPEQAIFRAMDLAHREFQDALIIYRALVVRIEETSRSGGGLDSSRLREDAQKYYPREVTFGARLRQVTAGVATPAVTQRLDAYLADIREELAKIPSPEGVAQAYDAMAANRRALLLTEEAEKRLADMESPAQLDLAVQGLREAADLMRQHGLKDADVAEESYRKARKSWPECATPEHQRARELIFNGASEFGPTSDPAGLDPYAAAVDLAIKLSDLRTLSKAQPMLESLAKLYVDRIQELRDAPEESRKLVDQARRIDELSQRVQTKLVTAASQPA